MAESVADAAVVTGEVKEREEAGRKILLFFNMSEWTGFVLILEKFTIFKFIAM